MYPLLRKKTRVIYFQVIKLLGNTCYGFLPFYNFYLNMTLLKCLKIVDILTGAGAGFWQRVFKFTKVQKLMEFINCYSVCFILVVVDLVYLKIGEWVFKMMRNLVYIRNVYKRYFSLKNHPMYLYLLEKPIQWRIIVLEEHIIYLPK
jgi:hypothetical protein